MAATTLLNSDRGGTGRRGPPHLTTARTTRGGTPPGVWPHQVRRSVRGPTFEVLDLVRRESRRRGGAIGSTPRPCTADDPRSYADLVTREGLREVATYADAVGAAKDLVLPRNADGATTLPSSLVDDAHARGLAVHVWTLRDENQFMACRP
jgi:glycerophosphoryl diester phosphodiesterase